MAVPNCTVPAIGVRAGREFIIASDADFVIRLTPSVTGPLAESTTTNNNQARRSSSLAFEFRVSRGVLIAHSAFFRDLFCVQPALSIIGFENNTISFSMEVWLRAIHNGADTIPLCLKATHSERVWNAIAVGEQFGFAPQHTAAVKPWFLAHYHDTLTSGPGLTPMVARSFVFPCFFFDHAEGFMKLTKYLAYNITGTSFSHNPSAFQTLGVDARFLDGPLTAARSYIQFTLERAIFSPLERLHRARCPCRKETAFDYEDALMSLGCWPLDEAVRRFTLSELLEKLKQFDFTPKATTCESGVCHHNFTKSVHMVTSRAKQYFDGLCLDCMNRSKPVTGQPYDKFIEKNSPYVGCWDMGCRFGHGRPSWYLSWMGPTSIRTQIVRNSHNATREKRQRAQESQGTKSGQSKRTGEKSMTSRIGVSTSINRQVATSGLFSSAARSPNSNSDKENSHDCRDDIADMDDDDEFFDAEEDTYLDGVAANQGLVD